MSEDIAFNEADSIVPAPSLVHPLRLNIARQVSTILSPSAISLPLIFLVALYHAQVQAQALLYALVTLFFASAGPLLYIVLGVRLGKFTDIDVSVRSQRTWPFIFGLVSTTVGLLIITLTHGPKSLETLLILVILSGVIMMIITLWWKISLHTSSIAGAVTILTAFYGAILLPTFLLVIAVGWSRVVLRRHTVAQVTAGAILSTIITILVLTVRGR